MSSTAIKDLYKYIRYEVVRKNDQDILPAEELELAIEYIIKFDWEAGFTVNESQGNKSIEPELTDKQKKLLILKTALSLLIPEDSFSYRTASLSKFLEGTPGLEEQREDLRRKITLTETGDSEVPSLSSDEFGLYCNQATRFSDTVAKAQANG